MNSCIHHIDMPNGLSYTMTRRNHIKKFIAELIGTCVLVVFGCGTAMITGCEHWGGYLLTALAFGLVIVGMAYCVGNISGCHINSAVSIAVFMNKGISGKDFGLYVLAQCLGAWFGAGILALTGTSVTPQEALVPHS